jgi:hypothetical protein
MLVGIWDEGAERVIADAAQPLRYSWEERIADVA